MNSKKLTIAGQGIDVNKFCPADKIKNNGEKIILSAGRISPVKNYEVLIRAADILVNQKNIRNLKFQIAGGIPVKSQKGYLVFLKDMVRKYKLEDYVHFAGPIPYTHIQNYYQNCDLFISTSNTGSLDKAILEAMACQKITLTSNESFTDLLKGHANILLFDKNDTDALAKKIIYILDMDTKDKDDIGYGLREIVARNHNLDSLIDNLQTVFKDTIGNRQDL